MANPSRTRTRADGSDNSEPKQAHRGRFQKGKSGNPAGKPTGSRNKATLAVEALLQGQAEQIGQVCIQKALDGDTTALRLVMERVAPVRKGRPVEIAMPKVENAAGVVAAIGSVLQALGDGRLTPEETATIAGALEVQRRSLEVADLERRIEQLEERGR